jgi:hypothetical protein
LSQGGKPTSQVSIPGRESLPGSRGKMAGWNQPAKYLSGLPQNDHTQCSAMFPAGLILARPPLVMLPWEEVPSQFPQATWCGSTQSRGHSSLPQGLLHAVRFWGLLRAGIWMMVGPPGRDFGALMALVPSSPAREDTGSSRLPAACQPQRALSRSPPGQHLRLPPVRNEVTAGAPAL